MWNTTKGGRGDDSYLTGRSNSLSAPEVLEPRGRLFGIANHVLDVLVAQVLTWTDRHFVPLAQVLDRFRQSRAKLNVIIKIENGGGIFHPAFPLSQIWPEGDTPGGS